MFWLNNGFHLVFTDCGEPVRLGHNSWVNICFFSVQISIFNLHSCKCRMVQALWKDASRMTNTPKVSLSHWLHCFDINPSLSPTKVHKVNESSVKTVEQNEEKRQLFVHFAYKVGKELKKIKVKSLELHFRMQVSFLLWNIFTLWY